MRKDQDFPGAEAGQGAAEEAPGAACTAWPGAPVPASGEVEGTVEHRDTKGNAYRNRARGILLHVVNHSG